MHNYLLFSYHITDRHLAAGIYTHFRQVNETGLLETKSNWLKFSCLFIILKGHSELTRRDVVRSCIAYDRGAVLQV